MMLWGQGCAPAGVLTLGPDASVLWGSFWALWDGSSIPGRYPAEARSVFRYCQMSPGGQKLAPVENISQNVLCGTQV